MPHPGAILRDQRGVALPLALIALLILTMLVLTVLNLGAVEPQISKNLADTARARHLAEAGIEWALDCIADRDLTPFLAGPDSVQDNADDQLSPTVKVTGAYYSARLDNTFCNTSPAPGALPGLTAAAGTFAVTIRNDYIPAVNIYAGDQILTGQAVDNGPSGGRYADGNNIVIVTATGTFGNASRSITAVIQRNWLNVNAAASLPGNQADTFNATVGNQTIDGRDWTRTDANGGSPSGAGSLHFGVATQTGTQTNVSMSYEARAESAFDTAAKLLTVKGRDQTLPSTSASVATGLNSIAADTALTPAIMQNFLSQVASNPQTTVIQSSVACPLVLTGSTAISATVAGEPNRPILSTAGSSCPGNPPIGAPVDLGTPANPKLVYFRGQLDTSSTFIGLQVNGQVRGAGILVVEDGDLKITTSGAGLTVSGRNVDFYWDGIVIVTGRYVGTGFRAGSNVEIRGAFIANETIGNEANGYFEFLAEGNTLALRNSKQNTDMALRAAYNQRVMSWREN